MAKARRSATARHQQEREQAVFDGLRLVLERLGHDVHVSRSLEGRGGACLVRGARRVIVSRRLPMGERVDILMDLVRAQDLSSSVEIPDSVAALITGPATA